MQTNKPLKNILPVIKLFKSILGRTITTAIANIKIKNKKLNLIDFFVLVVMAAKLFSIPHEIYILNLLQALFLNPSQRLLSQNLGGSMTLWHTK